MDAISDEDLIDRSTPHVVAAVRAMVPIWLDLAGLAEEPEAWAGGNIGLLLGENARRLVAASDVLIGATTGIELYAWAMRGGLPERPQISLFEAEEEFRALPRLVRLCWSEFALKADLFNELLRQEAEHTAMLARMALQAVAVATKRPKEKPEPSEL